MTATTSPDHSDSSAQDHSHPPAPSPPQKKEEKHVSDTDEAITPAPPPPPKKVKESVKKDDGVPGPPGPPKGPHRIHRNATMAAASDPPTLHAPPPPKKPKAPKETKVSSDESESDSEADEREEMEERARLQLREMNEELGIEEKPLEVDVNRVEAVPTTPSSQASSHAQQNEHLQQRPSTSNNDKELVPITENFGERPSTTSLGTRPSNPSANGRTGLGPLKTKKKHRRTYTQTFYQNSRYLKCRLSIKRLWSHRYGVGDQLAVHKPHRHKQCRESAKQLKT